VLKLGYVYEEQIRKFVGIQYTATICQVWPHITAEVINFIANYTYQIPKFCLVTRLRVNMEVVQQFFKSFMKYDDVDTKIIFK
jgi:CTP synthase (UTP-ammonia lyase)